jgi:hypothetical protein
LAGVIPLGLTELPSRLARLPELAPTTRPRTTWSALALALALVLPLAGSLALTLPLALALPWPATTLLFLALA